MYKSAKPLFFRTETPMHAGSGSDLGHIDLPIQREKHTNFPNVQSSSLKGAFREHVEQRCKDDIDKIGVHLTFGYDRDGIKKDSKVAQFFNKPEDRDYSGSLAFTDARLLLFPLKSYRGVYALATCPMILKRFYKEMNFVCTSNVEFSHQDFSTLGDNIAVANADFLTIDSEDKKKVILEEYAFDIESSCNNSVSNIAEELTSLIGIDNEELKNRLVVLPDEVFRDFIVLSTEVITRTKIQNDTGTVQSGALFTEEYLPSESYMYSIIAASNVFQTKSGKDKRTRNFPNVKISTDLEVLNFLKKQLGDVAQIGGSSTLGKGIVKLFKKQLSNGN